MRRASRTARSSCPRCTPSAPASRARSGRSFTMKIPPSRSVQCPVLDLAELLEAAQRLPYPLEVRRHDAGQAGAQPFGLGADRGSYVVCGVARLEQRAAGQAIQRLFQAVADLLELGGEQSVV